MVFKKTLYLCHIKCKNVKQSIVKIVLFVAVIFIGLQKAAASTSCYDTFSSAMSLVEQKQAEEASQSCACDSVKKTDTPSKINGIKECLDKLGGLFCDSRGQGLSGSRDLSSRLQRHIERIQNTYLRLLLFYCSLREVGLLRDKEHRFPATLCFNYSPSCNYFVFALREILI